MKTSNIFLGKEVYIENNSRVNNARIGDDTKIAGNVRLFGSEDNLIEVGVGCYFGLNSIIEGYNAKVTIGNYVSFAQNIILMSGSGPNASLILQKIFPIVKGEVIIGDHSWIGANVVIMPNLCLGKFCIVAANSFLNSSFPDYSIIGGTPAKLIRKLSEIEINKLENSD